MEPIFSSKALVIQAEFVDLGGCLISLGKWAKGLAIKLLEATHGQWLYRNMLVHDTVSGLKAAARKEELHMPGSVGGFQWSTLCGIRDHDSTSLDSQWTR